MERRTASNRDDSRDDRGGRGRDDRGTRDRDDRGGRGRDEGRDERGGRDRDDRGSRDRDDRGGRSTGYRYQARSKEQYEKRASGSNDFDVYVKDSIKMFKPHDGPNTIRILPPTWDGADHYGIDAHVHYGIGADNQSYLCLKEHKGEDCPICEERAIARRDGDEDYQKELRVSTRTLVYLIDRDNEKDGVQAYAMPPSLDQAIVKVCIDRRTGDTLPIDHPDDGFDVEFEKTGTGLKTKYVGVAISRRSSPLGKDAWLQFAIDNPLPDQLNFYAYDHIAKEFGGGGGGGRSQSRSGRDDDRDTPRGGRDDRGSRDRSPPDDDPRDRNPRGGRDERGGRDSGRKQMPTKDEVMKMAGDELDQLIANLDLDIKPNDFDSDEDLQDAIIKDLKLEDEAPSRRRATNEPSDDDRLAKMRREREGR